MRYWLLAAAALFGFETAAHACQCDDPAQFSVTEQDQRAAWIAGRDYVVAEVVRLDRGHFNEPIRYRVVKPLIGDPPDEIVIMPSNMHTSCDYWGTPGEQQVMAFGSSPLVSAPLCGVLARLNQTGLYPAGMCTQFTVQAPGMVERIRRLRKAAQQAD